MRDNFWDTFESINTAGNDGFGGTAPHSAMLSNLLFYVAYLIALVSSQGR